MAPRRLLVKIAQRLSASGVTFDKPAVERLRPVSTEKVWIVGTSE